ncbi:MAG: fibronectin type III domain-containing protein [Bacteroidia bacterium]|nr:fibronectin type III domain-containing protein [Bacteroidia bacterium]
MSNIKMFAQCPVPTGLTAPTVSNNSVQLSWTTVAADSFLLRYYDMSDSIYLFKTVSVGSATTTIISGLYPNTTYAWQIRTWCSGGASGAYQTIPSYFTTTSQPVSCVIPNLTVHSNITISTADLSWNTFIDADSFMVRYSEYNTTNYTWVVVPGTQHSITIAGLQTGVQYEWVVRCICASNPNQAYSRPKYFTTTSNSCETPDIAYFTSSSITSSSATVGWNASLNASGYIVRYAVRFSGNWISVSSADLEEVLSGLIPDTWYEFQIQSLCGNDSSIWSVSGIFQTLSNIIELTRGPYLQMSSPDGVYIRWRTDIPSDSKVTFGTSVANLNFSTTNTTQTTEHVVRLTGLIKGTKYYYSVGSSLGMLQGDADNYFITNPDVGSTAPVRIWAIGDFGRSSTAQREVRDSYEAYTGNTHTDVWLWLGDNAYSDGTDSEYQTKVFDEYPQQFKKWVTWPTSGNHDLHTANSASQTGPYYDNFTMPTQGEVGGVPSNTEAYYSFNYANIHFVCLESYGSAFRDVNGDMATWLANDLAANTQTFTIVYFHHPPYSKGSHDSDAETELIEMRENINPILEYYKVDLVLAGHSHSYERTMLLHGHYGNSSTFDVATMTTDPGSGIWPNSYYKNAPNYNGTVYVVCGTSGYIGAIQSDWPHNAMYDYSVSHYGSLVIDVQGNGLTCKYLTSTGIIRDEFTIIKPGFPTSTINQQLSAEEINTFSIWPNPVSQNATINYRIAKAINVRFDVLDVTGRVIYELGNDIEKNQGTHIINFRMQDANLTKGIYFMRMISGEEISIRRFVYN